MPEVFDSFGLSAAFAGPRTIQISAVATAGSILVPGRERATHRCRFTARFHLRFGPAILESRGLELSPARWTSEDLTS